MATNFSNSTAPLTADAPLLSSPEKSQAEISCIGTILVVEDEVEILEPLAHSLQKAGHTVLRAEDGLTACRIIGNKKPDLILLDIMLPDLDGWEVCKLLRQHPDESVASIPVIMLTALNSPHDKYRGLELGADAFLPKPYSIREVILQSCNLIRRRKQTVQLESRIKSLNDKEQKTIDLHHLLFHELRNQLLILNGYSELLKKNPDDKRAQHCRDAIHMSSSYLQTLAEEVMLLRQVEDGEVALPMEKFDINQLLGEIIKVYTVPAKEKCMGINHVQSIRQDYVYLNRTALKIILSSLLDNCIKFGTSGQKISISWQHSKDRAGLLVTDEGPGISPEDAENIFKPYFRSAQTKGQQTGTGVGLHAVRVLAHAMYGDASVESNPAGGSSFRVTFPLLPAHGNDTE
jgi:signal transduction histidine kinase